MLKYKLGEHWSMIRIPSLSQIRTVNVKSHISLLFIVAVGLIASCEF